MKLMRVASMELAAYFIISALGMSVKMTRKLLSRNGGEFRHQFLGLLAFHTHENHNHRSGLMKSLTAAPSFRNSGLLATSKGISPAFVQLSVWQL